uniref:Thioredoxin H-type 3 n=1 Tax=Tamarix hispida TaxID=189793 RepID=M1S0Z1_9CARY|nr:thioredoxin H-type 3 [Tamarix hispida]
MGTQISTSVPEGLVRDASQMPAPSPVNRVIAYHSTARWRAFFQASKESNKLVVVDFTATWCKPCQQMEPTLNKLAAKYGDVDFVKIDVDELMDVAREFAVQVMPTYLFLKNGKAIDRVTGARKEELQMKIEMHIA